MQNKSGDLYEKSKQIMPGGVNSPVRAFRSVGLTPLFIKKAQEARIIDMDGKEYIDYVGSWGPLILGHAHQQIVAEIKRAAKDGISFGAPTEREYLLGKMLIEALPSMEVIRLVNSGTEAVMSALRLARGYTGRDKILKFAGCYHGHSDGVLVRAGSGALTLGHPDSAGIPKDYAQNTLVAAYNDGEQLERIFRKYGNELAAVIIEPVAANMGVVLPKVEFLRRLRELASLFGVLLIFDEVITGFRISYGGAQGYYGIRPDITVLGKIIGGGMPVGAYGGSREIMKMVSPEGAVYQAGTLSGNPIAMAAGIKTLEILKATPELYEQLELMGNELETSFHNLGQKYQLPVKVNRLGSLLSLFFSDHQVVDYKTAMQADSSLFTRYFRYMLQAGIYLAPSQFEAMFISGAHTQQDLIETLASVEQSFQKITANAPH